MIKKSIFIFSMLAFFLLLILPSLNAATYKIRMCKYLTGGGTNTAYLDGKNGNNITVGDLAFVITSTYAYFYEVDNSGDAESSPDCIAPDINAGNKRYKLRPLYANNITIPNISQVSDITATATEINYTTDVTGLIQTELDLKLTIANPTFTGTFTVGSAGLTEPELEILDGATLDTTELNYLDGATGTTGTGNTVRSISPVFTGSPTLGAPTATSLTLDAVATPGWVFRDSGNPGTDKEIAKIYANFLSGGDGAEDGSIFIQAMLGGSEVTVFDWDSDTEALTLGDSGNGEDLIVDFDTGTANQVTYSSNSGVTELSFSAFNLVTTGIIYGAINFELADGAVTIGSADAHNAYGTIWLSDSNAPTLLFPASPAEGMSGCLMQGQGRTDVLTLDAQANDYIVLNGVRGIMGATIASTGAAGDKVCWACKDGTDIYIISTSGTWGEP